MNELNYAPIEKHTPSQKKITFSIRSGKFVLLLEISQASLSMLVKGVSSAIAARLGSF